VGPRIILKRATGLWSLKADGSGLVQWTEQADSFNFGAAGPFACFTRGQALWCVPADGSWTRTRVTGL
jgi:hypothetical protein